MRLALVALMLAGCHALPRPASAVEVDVAEAAVDAWESTDGLPTLREGCVEEHLFPFQVAERTGDCYFGRDCPGSRIGPRMCGPIRTFFTPPEHAPYCIGHETIHILMWCAGMPRSEPYAEPSDPVRRGHWLLIWHDAGEGRSPEERASTVEGRAREAMGGL